MKKILLLISFLSVAFFAFSQESNATTETNDGETLIAMNTEHTFVMGESVLDTRDMAGLHQSMTTLQGYSKDQKIAIAGWTLFAASFPLAAIGAGIYVTSVNDKSTKNDDVASDLLLGVPVGIGFMVVASEALVAGVVCLGVSYHRMGGHANLTDSGIRERKPLMTFNLRSSRDGLGFAIKF